MHLSAGPLTLDLAPELGGCVAAFRHDGVDLMRPLRAPEGQTPHALHSGMFPMVPFANSVRDNSFGIDGKHYDVSPNMAGARLNYHGSGWQRPWQVAEQGGDACRLVLGDTVETAGYVFAAEQRFALAADRLVVDVAMTNRSARRMPFGFGLHPWFPRHGDARATFAARETLREDSDFQALGLEPMSAAHDFRNGREPARSYQNRCYVGWDGVARIDWPSLGLGLSIEAEPVFGNLMFHVPQHDPEVFCLEPQSNRTSAFDGVAEGRPAPGVHILAPGESLSGRITFLVHPAAG
jgi:aldose 1-epimerase